MSNWGITNYVLEGENGINLYKKIMDSVEKCIEFDTKYKLGNVNGITYTIEKTYDTINDDRVMYCLYLWDDDYSEKTHPIVWSWFYLSDVKFENSSLFITEHYNCGIGAMSQYVKDVELYKDSGFYFLDSRQFNITGVTNEKEERYFKKHCFVWELKFPEFKIDDKPILCDTMVNVLNNEFEYWDFETKVKFCEDHKDYLVFEATRIIDSRTWAMLNDVNH